MQRTLLLLAVALPASSAIACPGLPDRSAELEALFEAARAAPNEMAGREVSNQMWAIWTTAPDEVAQSMLTRGMTARRYGDFLGAIAAFDDLVAYCPDYPEGYNQRAFIHYLSGGFEAANADLQATLALNPDHVGALSGLALTLIALGRAEEAQEWLRQALALNPWIPERGLLDGPLEEEL
ncbi:MAG: tetratricopeptide repeat protein [Pseudomonadota bacterium]